MINRPHRLIIVSLVVLFGLNACIGISNSPEPPAVPGLVNTLAVQTLMADSKMAAQIKSLNSPFYTSTPIIATYYPTSTAFPTMTPFPTLTPLHSQATPIVGPDGNEIPCNAASFVEDVTIPDDSKIKPGVKFTKTWRLKNVGFCEWTPKYLIVHVWGPQLEATSPKPMPTVVKPGETVDISINMVSPRDSDFYQSNWMLQDPDGVKFGVGYKGRQFFWAAIDVSDSRTRSARDC